MKQPEGFIVEGKENYVCLLQKSLYGLKQAPRLWHERLDKVLLQFGLRNSTADKCIYIRKTPDETTLLIVHVDDGIVASNKTDVLTDISKHLSYEFQMHAVPPTRFIGLNIHRDRPNKRIFLDQSHMIEKVSHRFGMSKLFPKNIPADPQIRLVANTTPKSEGEYTTSPYPYREAVGALLYIALMTRPDISYAVGQVSKFSQNPSIVHWHAVEQIFAYLNGTKNLGIWIGGNRSGLIGFTDADFAGDKTDYKSTSGSIFFFHNGPVSWSSKKQPCTALSTTEAEYVAACEATKTAVWLSYLLQDFTGTEQLKVPIHCDNQGAVRLAYNAEFHQKTKHISLKYHYIREQVAEGRIEVKYVRTNDQLADIFTKPLPKSKFCEMRKRIGVDKLE